MSNTDQRAKEEVAFHDMLRGEFDKYAEEFNDANRRVTIPTRDPGWKAKCRYLEQVKTHKNYEELIKLLEDRSYKAYNTIMEHFGQIFITDKLANDDTVDDVYDTCVDICMNAGIIPGDHDDPRGFILMYISQLGGNIMEVLNLKQSLSDTPAVSVSVGSESEEDVPDDDDDDDVPDDDDTNIRRMKAPKLEDTVDAALDLEEIGTGMNIEMIKMLAGGDKFSTRGEYHLSSPNLSTDDLILEKSNPLDSLIVIYGAFDRGNGMVDFVDSKNVMLEISNLEATNRDMYEVMTHILVRLMSPSNLSTLEEEALDGFDEASMELLLKMVSTST